MYSIVIGQSSVVRSVIAEWQTCFAMDDHKIIFKSIQYIFLSIKISFKSIKILILGSKILWVVVFCAKWLIPSVSSRVISGIMYSVIGACCTLSHTYECQQKAKSYQLYGSLPSLSKEAKLTKVSAPHSLFKRKYMFVCFCALLSDKYYIIRVFSSTEQPGL